MPRACGRRGSLRGLSRVGGRDPSWSPSSRARFDSLGPAKSASDGRQLPETRGSSAGREVRGMRTRLNRPRVMLVVELKWAPGRKRDWELGELQRSPHWRISRPATCRTQSRQASDDDVVQRNRRFSMLPIEQWAIRESSRPISRCAGGSQKGPKRTPVHLRPELSRRLREATPWSSLDPQPARAVREGLTAKRPAEQRCASSTT